ncbi:MAG: ATP-binding protein [Pirellulaceae bacterium]
MATKFSIVIIGVVLLATASSLLAIVSTWRVGSSFSRAVTENLPSVRAAAELETALLIESRALRSFVLDAGNRQWLEEIRKAEEDFDNWMEKAQLAALTPQEVTILNRMEDVHRMYQVKRQEVIALSDAGEVEKSRELLLQEVTRLYQQTFTLCEDYLLVNERKANQDAADAQNQIHLYTGMVLVCAGMTLTLGALLLRMFWVGVLRPLRSLVGDARGGFEDPAAGAGGTFTDELHSVGAYLRTLMSDAADARTALAHTRSQLMNAQKLASVGKLAASVAHELRNPLTSIKMWLFSIQKTIGRDEELDRKFRTISEEITRMESVVRNFLEFSRPPELKLRSHSISLLLDKTLELVGHRIEQKKIRISRDDGSCLPPVKVDADQFKQVFVNLLENAAEALVDGGEIYLTTVAVTDPGGLPMVRIRIRDTGPGMPDEVSQRVFEPFFTTKEDGAGLGLCIAARIMARHGGRLVLESSMSGGTSFAVWIPAAQVQAHE